ncbi:hypothetical protein [Pseudomonas sp. 10S4]|uniref:hypothetical protein n=1 Tax=Pseudomonas sp. 10S4 TaxID=3048583 RepID=UPI002AC97BEB|nr:MULTISPECIES: hypothetical protein [unclassified Pseudomonas]MEB0229079.1 hypothetical protein [Pseudomonas sp. 5S1]MEB0298932.1 hypothetical protein [Pseudomonas sp. 10S4]WPX17458.1 hypothetical protein RHM58_26820 [Pseudomonas sp. 10S4]
MDRFLRFHTRLVQLELYCVIFPAMCVYTYFSFRYVPLIALFALGSVSLLILLLIPLFQWWGLLGLVRLFKHFRDAQVRVGLNTWLGIAGSLVAILFMVLWKENVWQRPMLFGVFSPYLAVVAHWTWLYWKKYRQSIAAIKGFRWVVVAALLVTCFYAASVPLDIDFGRF